MEACGGAHFWGREIQKMGLRGRLIPPALPRLDVPLTWNFRLKLNRRVGAAVSSAGAAGLVNPRYGMLTFRVFWRRLSLPKFGTAGGPISRSRLSTNPVVCRSAIPSNTFIVRQVWMAASL